MERPPLKALIDETGEADLSSVRMRAPSFAEGAEVAFRALIESIPLPAWLHDVETFRILAVNDALLSLTKRTRDTLVDAEIGELFDAAAQEEVRRRFGTSRSRHEGSIDESIATRFKLASGRSWPVRVSARAVPAVSPGAYLAVAHEIPADEAIRAPASGSPTSARRKLETAVEESEQRYRALLDVCPIAACVYDLATLRFLAVNDAMIRQYGYSREELHGMAAPDLAAPEDCDLMTAHLESSRDGQASAQGAQQLFIVRHRRKDQSELDVELIEAPLVYAGQRARLVLHRDITEQKRAEAEMVKRARIDTFRAELGVALMTEEPLVDHFERVTEAMMGHLDLDSVGVWILDEGAGLFELVSHAGTLDVATAGGTRLRLGETWIGRVAARGTALMMDTMDPRMRPLDVALVQQHGIFSIAAFPLITRGRVVGVLTAGSRATIPAELVVTLRGTAAQIAHVVGAAVAYEALRIGESLSRSILANMLSGLVTLSTDGVVETTNPAALSMFGYTRDDLIGRPFVSLFSVPPQEARSLLAKSRGRVTEQRGRKKNGDTFPCELRLFHLESLRGPGYAAIIQDLSERFEVERMKAELVSIVSHELRTPLTALRGSIGLLTGGVVGALPEEAMEMLQIAERNTQRLISLVNDILDFERLQRGKSELFIQPTGVEALAVRAVESVKPFADQEQLAIDVRCCNETILADSDRVVQVLVNLLSNAIKFSPPGSTIEVSTETEPASVVFFVTDHGRGIPASHHKAIFERFSQVNRADSREKGGTGLGLAICKSIIEQHDGSIGVDSQEGVGSTFWFRLPRAIQNQENSS